MKILKELTKNDHKTLNYIQIHGIYGKKYPLAEFSLVLITKVEHSAKQSLKVEQTQKAKL